VSVRVVRVHATCLKLGRAARAFRAPETAGVLILGSSGSGKSDLALRLIALGATLVADDQTELFVKRGKLHGRAPERIAGLMEIRGLGILDMPHAKTVTITLAVQLARKFARMPAPARYTPPQILGVHPRHHPPLVTLDAREPSAPDKLRAAAAKFARGTFPSDVKQD